MLASMVARFSFWLSLAAVLAAPITRAEIILDQFSAAHPVKIMATGDSITDDCEMNGAWRAPLQPILEGLGINFTNTGRLQSIGTAGFTKRRHEGYCGAVVGAPGVFAVYNYSTTDAYLQKILRDALAITNNRPDLVLVLIGANDIGRGRNPWQVATNDVPTLLSVIFSNTPNANVILSKITTLQNASLGYSAYATNVPIYNAGLEVMVNQRRAQGQNVFLADMFSAVDYGTMFMSDHLHPNAAGLKAIAQEWATRIQTISVRTDRVSTVFINGGAEWNYFDKGEDPGTNWMAVDFDDSGWSRGPARLGYGDPATATTVSYGSEATNKFVTTYFRRPFVVPWNAVITNLNFRVARTDGAVVWLDGQEMFRVNLPDTALAYRTLASKTNAGFASHIFYPTNIAFTSLTPGTNVITVEVHQSSVTNSALGFDMELIGSGPLIPSPALAITASTNRFVLNWPATNAGGFTLYSTTNLSAPGTWTRSDAFLQTNGDQIVVTQSLHIGPRFFRLQRP